MPLFVRTREIHSMGQVTVAAVADVSTGHASPQDAFASVLEPLRSADLRFAQVERLYSERGCPQLQAGQAALFNRQRPRLASAFKSVPFDVLSIASNMTGYWGSEAVEDTAETFRLLGIATVGAGRDIAAARKPAIFTRNGLRIAFLGYVSTTLPQFWATETRAGSAPMRAHTFYESYEYQPGAPARVVTIPHAADLAQLVSDVKLAKQNADLVFVSLHWGVHFVPRPCDYQPVVAHAAIDAGASVILGHHPHQPQGIEIYKKSVIFYSIGNFSFAPRDKKRGPALAAPQEEYTFEHIYSIEPDPGFFFDCHRHFNEGGIVFIEADQTGIKHVTYLPTLMNEAGQPEVVHPNQLQFEKSLTYLNWAGKFIAGGMTQMKAMGDRYEIFRG
ncbi:MAG: CapA family protein [Betaproteobacteria bacterium]|nr:CapA family protein [Betaproteobacteria bacterium]